MRVLPNFDSRIVQHGGGPVDISAVEPDRFSDPHPGDGQQPDQRLVRGCWHRRQPPGLGHQHLDVAGAVDERRPPSVAAGDQARPAAPRCGHQRRPGSGRSRGRSSSGAARVVAPATIGASPRPACGEYVDAPFSASRNATNRGSSRDGIRRGRGPGPRLSAAGPPVPGPGREGRAGAGVLPAAGRPGRSPWPSWSPSPGRGGRSRTASPRPRTRPGLTTTRSASTAPGTGTSPCPCWPTRSSPSPPVPRGPPRSAARRLGNAAAARLKRGPDACGQLFAPPEDVQALHRL